MKRLFILIAIFCSALQAKAQVGDGSTIIGKISGILMDSFSKKTLDHASVSIFRRGGKSPLNSVLTNGKGAFKFDEIQPGTYKIRISYVGYRDKFVDGIIITNSKPDRNMGVILVVTKVLHDVQK